MAFLKISSFLWAKNNKKESVKTAVFFLSVLIEFTVCREYNSGRILQNSRKGGNKIKNNVKFTVKYSAVHSFYWSAYCSSANFAAVFLLSKRFTNSQIGMVLALASIFSVFLQPAAAAFADRTQKSSLKNLAAVMAGAAGILAAAQCFLPNFPGLLAVLFILELALLFTLQPLLNSLGMQLINQGIELNFGLARGTGSMAFAVLSILLGILIERSGANSLLGVSAVLFGALVVAVYTFAGKKTLSSDTAGAKSEEQPESKTGLISFFAQNKRFFLLVVAVTFLFCSHSMINNYLIQIVEHLGGKSGEMGIAGGIAAAIELPSMVLFSVLVHKIRCSSILKFSLFFFVVKSGITLMATQIWMIYAAQIFQCCSFALFIPASVYYVNKIIRREDLAKGQAFLTSAITLGGVTASLLGGILLDGPGVGGMLLFGMIMSILGLAIGFFAVQRVEV